MGKYKSASCCFGQRDLYLQPTFLFLQGEINFEVQLLKL
jgi:hypothetical protein